MGNTAQGSFPAPKSNDKAEAAPKPAPVKSEDE
jgi:hypothetical protein